MNKENETTNNSKPMAYNTLLCVVTEKAIKISKGQSLCKSCKRDDEYLQCLACKDYNQYQSKSIWDYE